MLNVLEILYAVLLLLNQIEEVVGWHMIPKIGLLFNINAKLIVKKPLLVMNSFVPSIGSTSQYLLTSTLFKWVLFSSDIILSLGQMVN